MKNEERKIYVKAVKAHKDCPDLYVELKDVEKASNSKELAKITRGI